MPNLTPESNARSYKAGVDNWQGINYPLSFLFRWEWQHRLWARFMCERGHHLLSECRTSGGPPYHSLVCDACQMQVAVDRIFPDWHDMEEFYREFD